MVKICKDLKIFAIDIIQTALRSETRWYQNDLLKLITFEAHFLALRKCLNLIHASVGQFMFSWTIFGQVISNSKLLYFRLYRVMEHSSVNDTECVFSLYISDSPRTIRLININK